MPALQQHRPPSVDALARHGEEVVLRVLVLVDQVHASLLRRPALAVAGFYETCVLPPIFPPRVVLVVDVAFFFLLHADPGNKF